MITRRLAAIALVLSLSITAVQAASPLRGRLLYENFCHHCHWSQIHYRTKSEVRSWQELLRVVAMWQAEMRLGWGPEEVADIASYLNWVYYGFPDDGLQ